jgi:hypothetical protein
MIINAWPSVVPQEDNYDRSALEYAILSGAPMKVVRLLQAVTINQTKKQAHEMSTKLVRRVVKILMIMVTNNSIKQL